MKVKDLFVKLTRRVVGDGARTLFWEDIWLGKRKLAEVYPRLYDISFDKMKTVKQIVAKGWDNVDFRRSIHGDYLRQWREVKGIVDRINLTEDKDRVEWLLSDKKKFVVRDVYLFLKSSPLVGFRGIWKLKMPMKIRIFLWLMIKNSILTKDNLAKRGWVGNEECYFCGCKESIDHLLFQCSLAKYIWQVVVCVFDLTRPPKGISNMMGDWIRSFPRKNRRLVMIGGAIICWTVWKTRNRACFDKKNTLMSLPL